MTARPTIHTVSPVCWEPSAAEQDRHHLHLTKMHTTEAGEITKLHTVSLQARSLPDVAGGGGGRGGLEKEVCLEEVVLGLFLGDCAHPTP